MRSQAWIVAIPVTAVGGSPACGSAPAAPDAAPPDPQSCSAQSDGRICVAGWSLQCGGGQIRRMTYCDGDAPVCVPRVGCRACNPHQGSCDGDRPQRCDAEGTAWLAEPPCDAEAGLHCDRGTGECADLCARAEEARSYIGCEYWAVTTSNRQLASEFAFAVAVANPQGVPAHVTIDRGDRNVATLELAPGAVEAVELPYVAALKGDDPTLPPASVRVAAGAYRIRSDVPVTAHQFNPLQFEAGRVFSHTNDASLLLPTATLTGRYLVMSRPALMLAKLGDGEVIESGVSPGFVALVGVEDAPVHVRFRSTAHVAGSEDGGIPALEAGSEWELELSQGEVLQLATATPDRCPAGSPTFLDRAGETRHHCAVGASYDLTGSEIEADGRVAVIGGHDCAFVPFDRWACDHLEQMLFPLDAWGREIVLGVTKPIRGEPNVIRVLSGADDNTLAFTPAIHPEVTLQRGDFFELESNVPFQVAGHGPLLVGQFLVGQDYDGRYGAGFGGQGDPAFSLGIPREQWRNTYDVLAPYSFGSSYVNVVAMRDQQVLLDGRTLTGFEPVEGTPFASTNVRVRSGAHHLSSLLPFGATVYGFASYTSYMYPGGLDLRVINPPH
jgi:hypothetical protein